MTQTATPSVKLPSDQDSSGRGLGAEELEFLQQAIQSGTLTSTKGSFVKRLEAKLAERFGVDFAFACNSGSAAIHCAVAAVNPEPGDEIITTPITDMGAITPILYQGAVPVFADVCPKTYNVTAETIRQRLSSRTKAIVVTHLFGNSCDMDPIMELAREAGVPVIEDCAQAFLSEYKGRLIGSIGDISCFSLQQGKHITAGEGGFVLTNNADYAKHVFRFINKAWGYGDPKPDHYFLALNYRMNELTGAVALAQFEKLDRVVEARVSQADKLTQLLQGLDGVETPTLTPESVHTYWKYCLWVDQQRHPDGTRRLAQLLKERGIASAPRYIQKPAFKCQVISDQVTFGKSRWPFTEARSDACDYRDEKFEGVYEGLASVLVLPWNESYTDEHVNFIASAFRESVKAL